jgi:hypothetical protein
MRTSHVLALLVAAAPGVGRAASPVPGVPQRGQTAVEVAKADREASAALALAAALPQVTLAGVLPQTTLATAPRAGCGCGCAQGGDCTCAACPDGRTGQRAAAPAVSYRPAPAYYPPAVTYQPQAFGFGGLGGGFGGRACAGGG